VKDPQTNKFLVIQFDRYSFSDLFGFSMVAYMKETKEPFDGQGDANPYTTKPGGKGGCCSVA
jgi:hypothetical protein